MTRKLIFSDGNVSVEVTQMSRWALWHHTQTGDCRWAKHPNTESTRQCAACADDERVEKEAL